MQTFNGSKEKKKHMNTPSSTIVQCLWNYCNVLSDEVESAVEEELVRVLKEKEVKQFGEYWTKIYIEYGEFEGVVNSPIRHIDCWHKT